MPPAHQEMHREPEAPVTEAGLRVRYRQITEDILGRMGASGRGYALGLAATVLMMGAGVVAWGYQLRAGLGVTSLQHPMMWAVFITNFVWWIGIAHSGTMISAILFLFRASFRTAFSRAAESMTVIAIVTSAGYPIIHLGRAWRAYWLLPYPNQRDLWITFRSPLVLDIFAVVSYLTVSTLFFWLGLVPDLAIIRDRSKGWRRTLYGLASLGWEGTGQHWKHHRMAYALLAGIATPLVLSVHTIVSWDFSLAIVPGWHSTIFPVYFLAGAVFSGLAMVLTLVIPMRSRLRLEEYIREEHLDRLAQLVLMTSLILTFCYLVDFSQSWRSEETADRINLVYRATGPFAPWFWAMLVTNSLLPLALFWPKVRRSVPVLLVLSLLINVGMWLERFVTIAGSLGRDYLPYAWAQGGYRPTLVEWGISLGSAGWFLFWFLLFVRYLPVLPIAELKRECLKKHREEEAIRTAPVEAPA